MDKDLNYQYEVEPDTNYSIKVRIGDGQPGAHAVDGDCPYQNEPVKDDPEWISDLGVGRELIGKTLKIYSVTRNKNPNTNYVSVRVFINDEQIIPDNGYSFEVDKDEWVYFNQKIDFS